MLGPQADQLSAFLGFDIEDEDDGAEREAPEVTRDPAPRAPVVEAPVLAFAHDSPLEAELYAVLERILHVRGQFADVVESTSRAQTKLGTAYRTLTVQQGWIVGKVNKGD